MMIRNNGVEQTLDFEKDGLKPAPPISPLPVQPPRVVAAPPPVPPAMTRAEVEERLARMREFYQQQNNAALNLLPLAGPSSANLPPASRELR